MAKLLEIIHVQMSADCPDTLLDRVRRSAAAGEPGVDLTIYRRAGVAKDVSIHISRERAGSGGAPSPLGEALASELLDHGMVAHSVWVEHGKAEHQESIGSG